MRRRNAGKRRNVCRTGKVRYPDHEAAIGGIQASHRVASEGLGYAAVRAYECDICGGWHLTSKPPRNTNGE